MKKQEKHEMAISIAMFCLLTLWFELVFGVFEFKYWILPEIKTLKIIGSIVSSLGAVVFIVTVITMKLLGKPGKGWEQTTVLIKTGLFSIIRHPLYFAVFLAILGFFMMQISTLSIALFIVGSICSFLAAKFEDKWDLEKFGEPYSEYISKSKLFFPFFY
ncbi:MAG: isoprenylcysteine carboxylmethyltransferase family protein [Candidatus Marinimicrobia bacterium]|nr:isoprenylcysteine carboxylmethyltransferase family protein [Candidatus Neomarinimicrobiota bacterium]